MTTSPVWGKDDPTIVMPFISESRDRRLRSDADRWFPVPVRKNTGTFVGIIRMKVLLTFPWKLFVSTSTVSAGTERNERSVW